MHLCHISAANPCGACEIVTSDLGLGDDLYFSSFSIKSVVLYISQFAIVINKDAYILGTLWFLP